MGFLTAAAPAVGSTKKEKFEKIRQAGKKMHEEHQNSANQQEIEERPIPTQNPGPVQHSDTNVHQVPPAGFARPPTGPNNKEQISNSRPPSGNNNFYPQPDRRRTVATPVHEKYARDRPNRYPVQNSYLTRRPLESRDSMADVNMRRQDLGQQLKNLKSQLMSEREKVENQIQRQNYANNTFRMKNMNTYRLPTSSRGYSRGGNGLSDNSAYLVHPPNAFRKQPTQYSLLDAETTRVPVGGDGLDLSALPSLTEPTTRQSDLNMNDNFSIRDDVSETTLAPSITSKQIDELAERNRERMERLQKWKEEQEENDKIINRQQAIANADQVLDNFKNKIRPNSNSVGTDSIQQSRANTRSQSRGKSASRRTTAAKTERNEPLPQSRVTTADDPSKTRNKSRIEHLQDLERQKQTQNSINLA